MCTSDLSYFSVLVPWARFSWLFVSFWAHVNLSSHLTSDSVAAHVKASSKCLAHVTASWRDHYHVQMHLFMDRRCFTLGVHLPLVCIIFSTFLFCNFLSTLTSSTSITSIFYEQPKDAFFWLVTVTSAATGCIRYCTYGCCITRLLNVK